MKYIAVIESNRLNEIFKRLNVNRESKRRKSWLVIGFNNVDVIGDNDRNKFRDFMDKSIRFSSIV